jgi:hypothetical protein
VSREVASKAELNCVPPRLDTPCLTFMYASDENGLARADDRRDGEIAATVRGVFPTRKPLCGEPPWQYLRDHPARAGDGERCAPGKPLQGECERKAGLERHRVPRRTLQLGSVWIAQRLGGERVAAAQYIVGTDRATWLTGSVAWLRGGIH